MRFVLLAISLAFASAQAFACCPFDNDTLKTEVDEPATLDVIAGRVERVPFAYWEEFLGETRKTMPVGLERTLRESDFLDRLNRQDEALHDLLAYDPLTLSPAQQKRVFEMRARLALHLWWRGGAGAFPVPACVDIVSEASKNLPDNQFVTHLAAWTASQQPTQPDVMLRDFFNLRYAPNKTFKEYTPQLEELNLKDMDKQLVRMIELHPVWENFDTMHTLALCYALQGHQHLAHYTRLRAWEMHDNGQRSRLPGIEKIDDVRILTVAREAEAGVLRPVQILTDEAKQVIEQQFTARRDYANRWNKARQEHVDKKLANGVKPSSGRFWAHFEPPPVRIPPLEGPVVADTTDTPNEKTDGDQGEEEAVAEQDETPGKERGKTWMTLSVLLGVLFLGGAAKMRIDRSAKAVAGNEGSEKESE